MPNTSKTNQNHNRGMSKFSALRLKSRNSLDNNSSPKSEKISKYFQTIPKENFSEHCTATDSPYKNCLTEIKISVSNDSLSDENDFKTSEPCGKISKLIQTKPKKEQQPTKRRKNYKQTKLKLQDFTDTDPDHLQLALALSESSYVAENSSQSNDSACSTTSQDKMEAFKKALKQFGFQCTRSKTLSAEMKRNNPEVRKLPKKSRYRYITPVLYSRTDDERQTLISTKINEILANNQTINDSNHQSDTLELFSKNLAEIHNKHSKYFRLNSIKLEDMQLEMFYTKHLNLTPQKSILGNLLKNWKDIAGRDRSPSPIRIPETLENCERSLSPDLFESDVSKELNMTQIDHDSLSSTENDKFDDKSLTEKTSESVEIDLTVEEELTNKLDDDHNLTSISASIVSIEIDKFDDKSQDQDTILLNVPDDFDDCHNDTRISDTIQSTEPEHCNNSTEDLNVTEYVNRLLTQNTEDRDDCVDLTQQPDDNLTNSQESIVISDDELNYSSIYSTPFKEQQHEDDQQVLNNLRDKYEDKQPFSDHNHSFVLNDSLNDVLMNVTLSEQTKTNNPEQATPVRESCKNDCLIKTENITPMADYDQMNTPGIVDELKKFGVKPLKRQRGIQMLRYIYESTHPVVETSDNNDEDSEEEEHRSKIRKIYFDELQQVDIVGDIVTDSELENNELIFERNPSKKIASCAVPLQIVWYNFLIENPQIRKNILLYEPLQLEVLHSMLKQQGFKFHTKDLVTFLDRKCITIRTNQSNSKKRP